MTFRGHIQNGRIILNGSAELPEGAQVRVDIVRPSKARRETPVKKKTARRPKTIAERLASFIGKVKGYPADLAENHDHYLYGVPKRR